MIRRRMGVVLVLGTLLLGCFARLAADPSSLIVDADHPSADHARPRDDPAVGNDLTRLFLPHHLAIARSLAKLRRVPLWDDRGFGGRPLVGNPQAGLFYPPVWLAWLSGSPASLGWITVAHLLFAGVGTYRLSRTLGVGEWASLVAAGCFQASPYVLAQTFEGHYPHVWAACWYPWAFEAALKLRQGHLSHGLILVPILVATFLAGHPQEAYYLLIALGAWAVFDGIMTIKAGQVRQASRFWAIWLVILLLTGGMIAIELIPDALAQQWTLKGTSLPLRMAGRYHVYPLNLLQLLSPRALGGPVDYFGHENYWESVLSIGWIPVVLATIGFAWAADRRLARGWLTLVVLTILFAAGRKFGVFPLLFEVVPGMNRFRVPARSLFLASLGASLLAGLGVDSLLARAKINSGWGTLARRTAILSGLLIAVVFWGASISPSAAVEPDEPARFRMGFARLARDVPFWLATGVFPFSLFLAWKCPATRRAVAVSLGILGLVELGFQGHDLIVTTPSVRYFDSDPISEALLEARPPGLAPTRIRVVDALYDDLRSGQAGFTKTNVNDSFQIQHAADLYETLYHLFDDDRFLGDAPMDRAVFNFRREIRQGVLNRMNVTLLVDDRLDPEARWPRVASPERCGSAGVVYRNPSALPRAYVVPRVEISADDRFVVGRFLSSDPHQVVLMPFDPLGMETAPRQPFTPAEWTSDDPDRVTLKVETQAPGLLVIAETWMPGWSAVVDGKPSPIFRGNRAQRVVPLPEAGRHEVVMTYRTPGLNAGMAVTIGSAILWLAGLTLSIVRPGTFVVDDSGSAR